MFTEKGLVADGVESREGMGVPTLALYKCKTALSDSQLLHSIAELLQEPQVRAQTYFEKHARGSPTFTSIHGVCENQWRVR